MTIPSDHHRYRTPAATIAALPPSVQLPAPIGFSRRLKPESGVGRACRSAMYLASHCISTPACHHHPHCMLTHPAVHAHMGPRCRHCFLVPLAFAERCQLVSFKCLQSQVARSALSCIPFARTVSAQLRFCTKTATISAKTSVTIVGLSSLRGASIAQCVPRSTCMCEVDVGAIAQHSVTCTGLAEPKHFGRNGRSRFRCVGGLGGSRAAGRRRGPRCDGG